VDSSTSRRRLVEIPGRTDETASLRRRRVLVVQMTTSDGLWTRRARALAEETSRGVDESRAVEETPLRKDVVEATRC
jgi:hypothetical protein